LKGGLLKLGDFGFAAQKDQFQTILGTYPYMAPEIFKEEEYNNAVDVWALGVLFH
jgi:serine/threonine protein kinase